MPTTFVLDSSNSSVYGNAEYTELGSVLLTTTEGTFQTGAVTTDNRYNLDNDFTFSVVANFGDNDAGADGISWFMHNDPDGSSQLGQSGGGGGLVGIENGVAIEFDTWQNTGDLANDHAQLRVTQSGAGLSSMFDLGNIEDGLDHDIDITWTAATNTLTWSFDGVTAGTYAFTEAEMDATFGPDHFVYFGMVASTGAAQNFQSVTMSITAPIAYVNGTDGDDILTGTGGSEEFVGGLGNDTIYGAGGSDTYVFVRGDGQDTYDDNGNGDTDVLRISGYTADELILSPSNTPADTIVINFVGTTDQVTLVNTRDNSYADAFEQVVFDDGTTWNMADIRARLQADQSTDGNDTIEATNGVDTLEGGLGNDTLYGDDGSDTYVFNRGDGEDWIDDNGNGDTDVLRIKGYTVDEVILTPSDTPADSIIVTFVGTSDQVTLVNVRDGSSADQIEQFEFDDGTIWTFADIRARLQADQATDGDDIIYATNGVDTLEGGLGNDTLYGDDGSDTYIFNRGDGQDQIDDNGNGDTDTVRITGYTPDEVIANPENVPADSIRLTFVGTTDSILLVNQRDNSSADMIERVVFDDGTIWTAADVRQRMFDSQSTDGNDTISGTDFSDTISGGLGNDTLYGSDGTDVYIFNRGDGSDLIEDNGFNDSDKIKIQGYTVDEVILTPKSANSNHMIISFVGTSDTIEVRNGLNDQYYDRIELIEFDDGTTWNWAQMLIELQANQTTDGNDTISGTDWAETLTGGLGDDTLYGGDGTDVYIFNRGDGSDVIEDNGFQDTDKLKISGYSVDEVTLQRVSAGSNTILVTFEGTTDSIQLRNAINDIYYDRIEQIVFDDGTVWNWQDMLNQLIVGQSSDGNDTITGTNATETLAGGLGDDTLYGGDGTDLYIFNRGDGSDVIEDNGFNDSDRLKITGYTVDELTLTPATLNSNSLRISFAGTTDEVIIRNGLYDTYYDRIEHIEFDDGTVWGWADIRARMVADQSTTGNDAISGTDSADTIEGGLGDDTIYGREGSDVYVFNRGDGSDVIEDNGFNDTDVLKLVGYDPSEAILLPGGSGSNHLHISFVGTTDTIILRNTLNDRYYDRIERIEFDDGTTWNFTEILAEMHADQGGDGNDTIYGTENAETMSGGIGNDTLYGDEASDVYVFARGDGQDVVQDYGYQDTDRIKIEGFTPSEAILTPVTPGSGNLLISFAGTNDQIIVNNGLSDHQRYRIEEIEFDDGTLWNWADIRNKMQADQATVASDTISGSISADTLEGGLADDTLFGGDGSDVYIFNRGDGRDVIEDNGYQDTDVLRITGYDVTEVELSVSGSSLIVDFVGTEDRVTLVNARSGNNDNIERIVFDDGTIWTEADVTLILQGGQHAPVALDDGFSTDEFGAVSGNVLAANGAGADYDLNYDTLTLTAVNGDAALLGTEITLSGGGLLTLNADGSFDFDTNGAYDALTAGQTALETITYTITDGNGGTDTATVSITVNGYDDNIAPLAADDSYDTRSDQDLVVSVADGVLANDSDPDGTPISAGIVTGPTLGVVTLNADGSFRYVANEGAIGVDTFTYEITDTRGGTDTGSVTVNVSEPPDLPDLQATSIGTVNGETGETVSVTYTVDNVGDLAATGTWADRLYLSSDNTYSSNDILLGDYSFTGTVDAGSGYTRTVDFTLPNAPQDYHLILRTNVGETLELEEVFDNNIIGSTAAGTISASYSATSNVDGDVFFAGSPIIITGLATATDGSPAAYKSVEIQISNDGFERTIYAFTDADGVYTANFEPLSVEGGLYTVQAFYPGFEAEDVGVEDTFNLLGMQFVDQTPSIEALSGAIEEYTFTVANLGSSDLTDLSVLISGAPSDWGITATVEATLEGNGDAIVTLNVDIPDGASAGLDLFNIQVMSSEGATATANVDLTTIVETSDLQLSATSLTRGMLREEITYVEFEVTNIGAAISGPISVTLPDAPWLNLANEDMPTLNPGETTTITLALSPDENLDLINYSGSFVVSDGTDSETMNFDFRATSSETGEIEISVTDEFTYFAEGAPYVEDAVVEVRDAISNELVYSSTDVDAPITFSDVPVGYYKVKVLADEHSTYRGTIEVKAGETNTVETFLTRETVTYDWTVQEVELEDRYDITVESTFVTNVPAPVVVVHPASIDAGELDFIGESMTVNMTVTNHGLIAANNVGLSFDDHPFYNYEPLVDSLSVLNAQETVTIPVTITRTGTFEPALGEEDAGLLPAEMAGAGGVGCSSQGRLVWEYVCGDETVNKGAIVVVYNVQGNCEPGIGGTRTYHGEGGGNLFFSPIGVSEFPCECAPKWTDVLKLIPGVSPYVKAGENLAGTGAHTGISFDWGKASPYVSAYYAASLICTMVECVMGDEHGTDAHRGNSVLQFVAGVCTPITATDDYIKPILGALGGNLNAFGASPAGASGALAAAGDPPENPDLADFRNFTLEDFFEAADVNFAAATALEKGVLLSAMIVDAQARVFHEMYGDVAWEEYIKDAAVQTWLTNVIEAMTDEDDFIQLIDATTQADLMAALPVGVPIELAQAFVDRMALTAENYVNGNYFTYDDENKNFVDAGFVEAYEHLISLIEDTDEYAEFGNFEDFLNSTQRLYWDSWSSDELAGVCAKVVIEIDQEAVLTRQGFEGTLTMENFTDDPLTNIGVEIVIRDEDGLVVEEGYFGVGDPELAGLTDIDGTGVLAGNSEGTAKFLFVPSNLAAMEGDANYTISGNLTYTEGENVVTVPLSSPRVTVVPQPELVLDYFQSRNIFGDDPFTAEIEDAEAFSLGLMIRNDGFGTANDFSITSQQPEIVDNEKGLLIDFNILGSQLNGEDFSPSLTVNFGDIQAGEVTQANWQLVSSLQGYFRDMSVSFSQTDNLGLTELAGFDDAFSLIKEANIHELVHMVQSTESGADDLPDYLVNDSIDPESLPDTLYHSDGTVEAVTVGTATHSESDMTDNQVSVTVSQTAGWSYASFDDLSNGNLAIIDVQRPDGSSIGSSNFWTTDRTFPIVGNPTYEDRVHILDYATVDGDETYTIIYGAIPDNAAPIAQDDDFAISEDGVLHGYVFVDNGNGEDTDAEGDLLVVQSVNGIATFEGRTLVLDSGATLDITANGEFTYDTNGAFDDLFEGEGAEEIITYTISDGNGGYSTATVTIDISGAGVPLGMTITGDELDNALYGAEFDDTINGLDGNDRLYGRAGDDEISGGAGNDALYGEEGSDTLVGDAGNDRLYGGADGDTMYGGLGNDRYWVNHADDTVDETGGGGVDRVYASVSHTLGAGVENLDVRSATAGVIAIGNAENNIIESGDNADTLAGVDGDDLLRGRGGNDTMDGGQGNDRLFGGSGDDVMYGGTGNDRYWVDSTADFVSETGGGGSDIVFTSVDWTLGTDLEALIANGASMGLALTGNGLANRILGGQYDDTITGLDGDDILFGKLGNDTLDGGAGADRLFGGDGDDEMIGGDGGDRYWVDSLGDTIVELAGEGTDRVFSTVSHTLSDNVEVLDVRSAVGGVTATGNALNNRIDSGAGADTLMGLDGADTLKGGGNTDRIVGGAGNDRMFGGADADTFVFAAGDGRDYVIDFEDGVDVIEVSGFVYADIGIATTGNNITITYGSDTIILVGDALATIDQDDFMFV